MGRSAGAMVAALAVGMIGLTAALGPAVGGAAGGETPVTVVVGDEAPANFGFGISPDLLPAADPGTTELKVAVEASTPVGIGPGIAEAKFGLDRSIRLERGDLPVCRVPGVNAAQIQASGAVLCPRAAVIGHAEAAIEIALPEAKPMVLTTEGRVYVGGTRDGVPDLLVALRVGSPVNARFAFLVPQRSIRHGRIGTELTFTSPVMLGGDGFFRAFQLDLKRGFDDRGERTGYVTAECRDGKLAAKVAVGFTDGTQYSEESVRACGRSKDR